ncbi:hypothetical protein Pst134EA_004811 [Puccinia striiformis f. sp. tritici]|uniref:hypothetical protein n=1 Tax=Puccinia striiformis f. sp. tritici TaxID=168172 RepID=UPI002007A9F4|nr:hypothetical protein Pst134EA_004811 [Puccinia striiformis f. sp. tritici]KAH9461981.1 hypothetical protein Pst134EB_005897 [Puccinia striiformis f. sp. tritici]KAH9470898.1 hypothetical protein Pst134EA_004811 [Puccinia striiformis f. sp. tritici]
MNQQELEYSLILLTKNTTKTEISSSESNILADHFLNHRWNSIIKHPKLKNYCSLGQKHQLSLRSSSPGAASGQEEEKEEEEQLIKLVFIATLLPVYIDNDSEGVLEFQIDAYRIGVLSNPDLWISNLNEWLKAVHLLNQTIDKLRTIGPQLFFSQLFFCWDSEGHVQVQSNFGNWKW